jgi:hypothetical protein
VAKIAGVSTNTVSKAKTVLEKGDAEAKANIRAGKSSIHAEYKAIVEAEKQKERDERHEARTAALPKKSDRYEVFCCGVADLPIADASVDCIITALLIPVKARISVLQDPRYPQVSDGL